MPIHQQFCNHSNRKLTNIIDKFYEKPVQKFRCTNGCAGANCPTDSSGACSSSSRRVNNYCNGYKSCTYYPGGYSNNSYTLTNE